MKPPGSTVLEADDAVYLQPGRSNSMSSQRLAFIILLVYILVVLLLHVIPMSKLGMIEGSLSETDVGLFRGDHLLHAAMFIPWGMIAFVLGSRTPGWSPGRVVFWVGAGVVLAVVAEGIQYFLPHRSFNWADMFSNISGVAIGFLLMLVWRFFRP